MLLTFTKSAAEEMKERAKRLLGSADQVQASTIHAFCLLVGEVVATCLFFGFCDEIEGISMDLGSGT